MANGIPDFPPTKLRKYPHMFPLDIAIWERFLDRYGSDYDGFDYDIKVGTGTEPVEGIGEPYATMQRVLSKYRIDCIGYMRGSIHLFEVKPDAGTIALGQLETYIPLYLRDIDPNANITGAIVTDRELPDVRELLEAKGYLYFVV